METAVLAFDFGASGGRAIRGVYDGHSLTCQEVHRFENIPVEQDGHLCWDITSLMDNIHTAIKKSGRLDSLAFDSWGVDFGLLDRDGKLIGLPVHYRDSRTEGMLEKAFATMPAQRLYGETGNQIMPINTLFQLMASDLSRAETLLFMPDLFAYLLCGRAVTEVTIASTSQMLNPQTRLWSSDVLNCFGLPKSLFAPMVSSGSVIGEYMGAKVIAAAGHDTQCAVAAMPNVSDSAAFLSCGTWSLLGAELDEPILTAQSMELGLSNELGANGRVNYLKNIIGLWLIQESRREWRRQGQSYSYAELERLALEAPPMGCFINPDAPEFTPPGDVPERIRDYCRRTGQDIPGTVGQVVRCIYESLALTYRHGLEQLSAVTQKKFDSLNILGGGAKDGLLCQMTADCCGLEVLAGPVEATALGNIIIQLAALGKLPSIDAGRRLVRSAEAVQRYLPGERDGWNEAYKKYRRIIP